MEELLKLTRQWDLAQRDFAMNPTGLPQQTYRALCHAAWQDIRRGVAQRTKDLQTQLKRLENEHEADLAELKHAMANLKRSRTWATKREDALKAEVARLRAQVDRAEHERAR